MNKRVNLEKFNLRPLHPKISSGYSKRNALWDHFYLDDFLYSKYSQREFNIFLICNIYFTSSSTCLNTAITSIWKFRFNFCYFLFTLVYPALCLNNCVHIICFLPREESCGGIVGSLGLKESALLSLLDWIAPWGVTLLSDPFRCPSSFSTFLIPGFFRICTKLFSACILECRLPHFQQSLCLIPDSQ